MLERTCAYHQRRESEKKALAEQLKSLPAGDYVLELGCGHGHFLCALARKYADEKRDLLFAAVDKNAQRIERAQRKTDRAQLKVKWINAKVEDLTAQWPERCTLKEVFILFPDPWPKERHHKHRFVNEGLLKTLATKMSADGRLFFRTDHEGYFADVKALIEKDAIWKLDDKTIWPEGLPATVFEEHHPKYQSLTACVESSARGLVK